MNVINVVAIFIAVVAVQIVNGACFSAAYKEGGKAAHRATGVAIALTSAIIAILITRGL